jgi:hypothetical protein
MRLEIITEVRERREGVRVGVFGHDSQELLITLLPSSLVNGEIIQGKFIRINNLRSLVVLVQEFLDRWNRATIQGIPH